MADGGSTTVKRGRLSSGARLVILLGVAFLSLLILTPAGPHVWADLPLATVFTAAVDKRAYPAVDAADKEAADRIFAAALYPGHLRRGSAPTRTFLSRARRLPPFCYRPKTMTWSLSNSLAYYAALRNAGVPVEMHLDAEGKHAFGLRPTPYPITKWRELFEVWLPAIGLISP
jgi:hypothetical protein